MDTEPQLIRRDRNREWCNRHIFVAGFAQGRELRLAGRARTHGAWKVQMVTLDTLRREKRSAILQLADMHGARNIRVFGSVVRSGNTEDSDVDLLVEFERGKTLFDLVALKLDLEDLLGVKVDVVTPNSLRYMRDRVLTEALPL